MQTIELLERKILTKLSLEPILAYWRFKGRKIVFTNGCFDVLHLGHITYLAAAADMGDELIVGVNTDASVRRLKGENRPVNNENARLKLLAALNFVSAVVLFDEDTPLSLIEVVKPEVLVKGSDYNIEDIVGYDYVKSYGGSILCVDLVDGYSTSDIVDKTKK